MELRAQLYCPRSLDILRSFPGQIIGNFTRLMTYKRTWIPQEEKTHEIPDDILGEPTQNIRLLEDDVAFAELVREFLEAENFRVTTVSNGAEGLKRIGREQFDAIVCDMVMPGFPGDFFYFAVQKLQPR